MRSQVYEWANMSAVVGTASLQRTVGDLVSPVAANTSSDIFIGGIGNNITKPAETTATQFIVIEDVSCSPWIGGSVQVRINTTDYFQNPDVTQMNGVPGLASPYPRGCPTSQLTAATVTTYTPDNLLKSFDLYPDVYVLPGQVFQILYTPTLGTNDASVTDAGNIVVMAEILSNTRYMMAQMPSSQTNSLNWVLQSTQTMWTGISAASLSSRPEAQLPQPQQPQPMEVLPNRSNPLMEK